MHPFEWAQLTRLESAIAPYTWRAVYRGGELVPQHDLAGRARQAAELDLARLEAIQVLGHPAGILELRTSHPPDEVLFRGLNRIRLSRDGVEFHRVVVYGFRFGLLEAAWAIDEAARVYPYTGRPLSDAARAAAGGA